MILVPDIQRNEASAERVYRQLRADNRGAFHIAGTMAVEEIREAISVPVDYGSKPPTRSKPGEPPRKDKGLLYEGVSYEVTEDAGSLTLTVSSARDETPAVPEILEFELNRPYMRPSFDIIRAKIGSIIADPLGSA